VPPPYAADTNVYVRAANEPSFQERFEAFIQLHGPLIVSSVVVAEVLIGVADTGRHQGVIGALSAGTSPLAPRTEDWLAAGAAVGRLGGETITKSRSFWNDALLAAQCARLQVTLVTANAKDFRRLGRYLPVKMRELFP
jgi:predicted nucleic acid-binding protein